MKLVISSPEVAKGIENFLASANAMLVDYYSANFTSLRPSVLELDHGLKYIRVWKIDENGHKYAYCFIDKASGDILKCDGWKKPAKHARGNVLAADHGLSAVTPYGAKYL